MTDLATVTPTYLSSGLCARVENATAILELCLNQILGAGGETGAHLLATLPDDLAADALEALILALDASLNAHAHGCPAGSSADIVAAVREHICSHCAPGRDVALAVRAVRRGGFYLEQMFVDPQHWAYIVGLASAASLTLSEPDPYDTVGLLEVLLVEAFEADHQELSA